MKKEEVLRYERKHLEETKQWIKNEISQQGEDEEKLLRKIGELKKVARGSYSEELEISNKLYDIVHKNLEYYKESYNQPYFARIDFREYRRETESFYIGKFGLGNASQGEEVVIDWRAPIADLYYSGTQGEAYYKAPIGVIEGQLSLKRKFLFKNEEIKDIFDEGINEIILKSNLAEEEGNALIDEFLKINLEQSTGSKLKEVVATIQKEQNDIIRAERSIPIIVQGSAGSGKTTVALHRLAYLLYRYQDKLEGKDILVIAPNKLFLDYISEVLPNLGVGEVKQKTFDELAMEHLKVKGRVYSKDKKLQEVLESKDEDAVKYITNSSKVKGSMVFKEILDRYLKVLERDFAEIDSIKVEGYTLITDKDIKKLYTKDLSHLPINRRKDEIKRYLSLKLNEKIFNILEKVDFQYEYQVARTKKQMEDSVDRRKKLIEIYDDRDNLKSRIKTNSKKEFDSYFENWKGIDTKGLYLRLFEDQTIYEDVTGGIIPKSLWSYIKDKFKENNEKSIIDSDDLAAMMYLKVKIEGISENKKLRHIVVDEAQDYSLLQLYVISMFSQGNSLTIVGDIGQGIYYYKGILNWNKVIEEVFGGNCSYIPLTQSYRSTVEIINFANKVLKKQENNIEPAVPVLRHGEEPKIIKYNNFKDFAKTIDDIVNKVINDGKNSVAIIGRTFEECKKIRDIMKKNSDYQWTLIKEADSSIKLDRIIIPSYLTKGLEFDCSIIFNCDEQTYRETELDKKLLYVILTRALHYEYVFYNGEPSSLINI
ncbi:DNA helicase [Clostridium polyendosporum]|uniref:DNA 3'-5' helicase n=1 Tax=Clostridium polyendosporum TaxID=69208 RepID=A0A919S1H7_9CLOT|nr:RNA polymerase recycling motor HelD [Clostridium polyendosporum]GIM29576.1 DNA helicase [Clostridium polyendosporum]